MKNLFIIIGIISAYYFFFYKFKKDWQTLSHRTKFFKILALIALIGSAGYTLLDVAKEDLKDESIDYLNENRARLSPILYIDEIKSDTVYYHIEVKNTNPIPAKNLTYYCDINKQFSKYEEKKLESEISKDEVINIFTPLWIAPAFINKVDFSVRLYLYYDSIWKENTIHHREKFTFIIPVKILSAKNFNPTDKTIDNVKTMQELLYDKTIESLNENQGSLEFVVLEEDQKDSISYIINTDSLKIIYNIPKQEIIFNRIFKNEQIVLRKNLNMYEKKGYHVVLTWNHKYYKLYVNADSAEVRIKVKNPSPIVRPISKDNN